MNDFDKYIKAIAEKEKRETPESVKNKIDEQLLNLPENKPKSKTVFYLSRIAATAACFVFLTVFLLPNVSVAYAKAAEEIPVIGKIVRVVTIRNYLYSDDKHEMDIKVPEIENESGGADKINKEISELAEIILNEFYEDLEAIGDDGHSSVYVDYEVLTNTDKWFTLKISVFRVAGTGNINYEYYHLNKLTGETVTLGDIVSDDRFYETVKQDIKRQMTEKMNENSDLVYWVDSATFGDVLEITKDHNFYLNENGDIVIPFDKYEVAPGYMGTPEFTVSRDLIKDYLK